MKAADQAREHTDQRFTQLASHHQAAGEHEKRDGDQREALHLLHHGLDEYVQRNSA
jgi:hypothetical protein